VQKKNSGALPPNPRAGGLHPPTRLAQTLRHYYSCKEYNTHPTKILSQENVQVPSIDDFSLEYLNELRKDVTIDIKVRTLRRGDVEYHRVGLKGLHPSKA
jgi:hypothetical protein